MKCRRHSVQGSDTVIGVTSALFRLSVENFVVCIGMRCSPTMSCDRALGLGGRSVVVSGTWRFCAHSSEVFGIVPARE